MDISKHLSISLSGFLPFGKSTPPSLARPSIEMSVQISVIISPGKLYPSISLSRSLYDSTLYPPIKK